MSKNEQVVNLLNQYSGTNDPGLQYVLVDKDSVLFEYSTGLSDVKQIISMELSQTMAAFSMTKTITAIAILQLVEKELIELDGKVSCFIEHPYNSEITIRQLLNHTSGIPNPIPVKWVHLIEDHDSFNEQDAITEVLKDNPKSRSPGTKYKYSNIAYWILGQVIESVSRKSCSDYVTENIFQPLELIPEEIGFLIKNVDNHAKGYIKKWSFMNFMGRFVFDNSLFGENESGWIHIKNVYPNGPAFGGVLGTAKGFSVILQDLLSENSKLLRPLTKQLLYEQQHLDSGKNVDMTLGWHIWQLNGVTYYYKEGGGAGFRCEMRIYPENGIASVLMLNRTSFNFKKHLSRIDEIFLLE